MGETGTAVSPLEQSNRMHFEIIEHVTRPVMQLGAEASFLRIDSKIYEAEKQTASRKKKNPDGTPATIQYKYQGPPELMDVTDLVRNRACVVVVNEVLGSELRKKYKDDSYVGLCFGITKTKLEGRGYATFDIFRIKDPADQPKTQAPAPVTNGAADAATHAPKRVK